MVFVGTYVFIVPIPATGGYFNFGDIMIFASALTFGPIVGGIGGGVGSSLSDFFGGFSAFAPFTLVIKGLEGLAAGFIARHRFRGNLPAAWAVAGSIMVGGYFVTEAFVLSLGVVAALAEVPFNVLQVFAGGLVGIPLSITIKRRLPSLLQTGPHEPDESRAG